MSINLDKSSTAQVEGQIATPYTIPRVNLMPPEVFERRAVRKVQIGVGAGALACVALVAGGYAWSAHQAGVAQEDLAAQQSVNSQLMTEQGRYAEVPRTLALLQQAQAARDAAMSKDIQWATVMGQIAATRPGSTWLKTMTIAGPGATTGTTTTSTAGKPSVATITYTGSARDYRAVAAWLDSMKKVPHMVNPKLQSATLVARGGQSVVDFNSTSGLASSAYAGTSERTGD